MFYNVCLPVQASLYTSLITIPPPPPMIFIHLPTKGQNLLFTHPFCFIFFPFPFNLLYQFQFPLRSFLLFPLHFPLFSLPLFIFSPQMTSADIPTPQGGCFFSPINTPLYLYKLPTCTYVWLTVQYGIYCSYLYDVCITSAYLYDVWSTVCLHTYTMSFFLYDACWTVWHADLYM